MSRAALPPAGRRLVPWLLAAVFAAGGMAVAQLQPDWAARHPRFEVRAALGQRVSTSDVALTVTDVTVAKTLTQEVIDQPAHTSPGVYVVVHITGEARHETVSLDHSSLRDSAGTLYAVAQSDFETFGSNAVETQVPLSGTLVFAVPRRALDDGLELVAAPQDNPAEPAVLFDRSYAVGLDDPVVVPLEMTGDTRVRETYELPRVEFA
ncbi:MAG: hypothetical protein ACRDMV_14065 [Streptosporangiales bacterium]